MILLFMFGPLGAHALQRGFSRVRRTGTIFGSSLATDNSHRASSQPVGDLATCPEPILTFAAIGDYGQAGPEEMAVADLVKSWSPDFIITTGDNNYPDGAAATIDDNIGQYYYEFIGSYKGDFGGGPDPDRPIRFYPALGNHDWRTKSGVPPRPQTYLDYFDLPRNERYYDFVRWPVAFFAIDSDDNEPDGNSSSSMQAQWLRSSLGASDAPWKIVYMHHAPLSSSLVHGSSPVLQWPYREWGATAVLAGHDHTYERIIQNGLPYFVNGLGGRSIYPFGPPIPGSKMRYNSEYGAMRVRASEACITFEFVNVSGLVVDSFTRIRAEIYLPIIKISR